MTETTRDERLLRLATGASLTVAVVLLALKGVAWWQTGSVALLASLVDSLMDAGASCINLLAVRYALAPADQSHRFGHGKAEALAGLGQSLLILASGIYLVVEAIQRLLQPEPLTQLPLGIMVIAISVVVTTALVLLQRWVVKQTRSTAIHADSLHYRMDLLTNTSVLLVLGLMALGVNLPWLDPALALGIAAYTLMTVRSIFRTAVDELLDRELPSEVRESMLQIVRQHPEVHGVHDVRTRRAGRTDFVEVHLELSADLPLWRAHAIGDAVEHNLRQHWPGADIVIHHDPVGVKEYVRDEALAGRD